MLLKLNGIGAGGSCRFRGLRGSQEDFARSQDGFRASGENPTRPWGLKYAARWTPGAVRREDGAATGPSGNGIGAMADIGCVSSRKRDAFDLQPQAFATLPALFDQGTRVREQGNARMWRTRRRIVRSRSQFAA